jgi:hypothetical protein
MASSLLASEGSVGWAALTNNAISAPQLNGFRLTLTSGTPITTSDVTGAATVYLTPYTGNRICLFDGVSNWAEYSSAEISVALSGLTAGTNYDLFVFDSGGVLTLDTPLAWSSNTARATALVLQNGVWVKSGTTTKRYVGTFRATAATTTEDSGAKRFLFNANNRVPRRTQRIDATVTWTEASTTYTAMDAGAAAWKAEFVVGLSEIEVLAILTLYAQAANTFAVQWSIGLDSTTAAASNANMVWQGGSGMNSATFADFVGLGYHFINGIEKVTGGTATIWGTDTTNFIRSSMFVECWA